jgi:ribulose bisphosphate carboxylase small subunit
MADSNNPLDQIAVGQAQPAVLANELFDAMSPAAIFGRRARTCSGLTWGYYGGRYGGIAIAHGTIVLPASQANVYIVAAKADGTVSQSTSSTNWDDEDNYQRLYLAVTGSATVTSYEDHREWIGSSGGGGGLTQEQIEDLVGALLVAGSNITLDYNDSAGTLTITGTGGGGLTQEQVEDAVAALLVAGSNIDIDYNDSAGTLTITGTGGGTPGGSDTQVQRNNAGSFGGITNLTSDGTNVTAFTMAGAKANFAATAAGYASINLPHGTAPSSPVNGDVWTTSAGMYVRINGVTIGPLSTGGGSGPPYSEGSGVPADSPAPENGSRHLDIDTGILYTWSDYIGAWTELGGG